MKYQQLLKKSEIEWNGFECKAARDKLPEDVWAMVSAFSNSFGDEWCSALSREEKKKSCKISITVSLWGKWLNVSAM